jgi:hypothetical protein
MTVRAWRHYRPHGDPRPLTDVDIAALRAAGVRPSIEGAPGDRYLVWDDGQARRRLLDLFCGASGAARGYQLAGSHVTGVDLAEQPRYAGDAFIRGDALDYVAAHGREYDAIHASPPCQAYTALRRLHGEHRDYPDLVAATRDALRATGRPYVIENVPGAPLLEPAMLCGSMFGLLVRRHRLFESSLLLFSPGRCRHGEFGVPVPVWGDGRPTRREARERLRAVGVYGHHGSGSISRARRAGGRSPVRVDVALAREILPEP